LNKWKPELDMDEHAIRELAAEVKRGRLSRRGFLRTMVAAGLTAPMFNPASGALIGEVYGVPISEALRDEGEGAADLKPYRHRKAMYVYSIGVLR
jgi:hypothetical protein